MDGPIMRPACQGIEPSAMAFDRRARIDELRDQRQAARLVERPERVAQDGQRPGDAAKRTRPSTVEDERDGQGQRGEDLRAEQQTEAIGAVGQDAAEELEEHERHALREAEVAERQRVVRDLPGQPGEGDVLRPVPQDVEDQPDPVEAIVPPPQGGEGLDHSTVSTALPGKRRAIKSCATCAMSFHGRSRLTCGASWPAATRSASRRRPTDAGSLPSSVKR